MIKKYTIIALTFTNVCLFCVGAAAWIGPSSLVYESRHKQKEKSGGRPRKDKTSVGEITRTMSS